MSPLFYAAIVLLVAGVVVCFGSPSMGKGATVFWWVGFILADFGLVLFAVAVILYLAGPVQGIIGQHS